MPFSDLKKFWEAHFGGRNVQGGTNSLKRNHSNFPTKQNVISSDCKSTQTRTSAVSSAGHPTCKLRASVQHKTKSRTSLSNSLFHKSILGSADGKQSAVHCLEERVSHSSGCENEADNSTLKSDEMKCTSIFTAPCATTSSLCKPDATKELYNKGKTEPCPVSERLPISLESNDYSSSENVAPEMSSLSQCKTFSCESRQSTLKKNFLPPFESLEHSEYNRSNPQLHNIFGKQKGAKSTLTFVDTSSAPASVHSSPVRTMKGDKRIRSFFKSNLKFNEVHNFWKMREKKLVKESVKQRRCFRCGCYLNNSYYEQDGALYCEEDYWGKYGRSCRKCETNITGPVLIAGLFRFHPECFECTCCKRCISDGDLYALVLFVYCTNTPRSTLFCSSCYQGLSNKDETDDRSSKASLQTCQCTVIMVLDFYPMNPSFTKPEDIRQVCKAGYGITVKDPPVVLPTAEGISHPTGQIVCGIDDEEKCSLQIGDILLQVNGLSVDLNALDLIDRLFDDTNTPLQVTIQREMKLSIGMCLGQQASCTHLSPQRSPSKTNPCYNPFPGHGSRDFHFESPEVVVTQPGLPKPILAEVEATFDNLALSENRPLAFDLADDNSDSSCCNLNIQNNRSLDGYQTSVPTYSIGDEPIAIVPQQEGPASNLVLDFDKTISHIELAIDSGVEECSFASAADNDEEENGKKAIPITKLSNSIGNMSPKDPCTTLSKLTSDSNLINNVKDDSTFQDRQVSVTQQQLSSSESSNSELSANKLTSQTDIAIEMESAKKNVTKTNNISQAALTKLLLDVMKADSSAVGGKNRHNCSLEMNEKLPTVPPRVKRRRKKRKSLRRLLPPTIELPDDVKEVVKVKSATLTCRRNVARTEQARRSNSLRSDVSPVNIRQTSPRSKASSPKSTLTVHSSQGSHVCSDLSRSESMRICGPQMDGSQRVFRPCDLIHGEVLGQGFFGKAIKVTHRDTGEVMVLKVLNSLDAEVEKSFIKEVKVMRNLFHRNVIHFIGVLYKDRRLNIITEFVECGTLKDVLSNMEEDLPWQERVYIARDISAGMSYLHSRNIIHRDLNSGNCFVKDDGTVVVADFGLARIQPKSTNLDRKKRYTVVGNPYWMAPEMLYGNMYDERVDVFSFGIVLCEIIGRVEADPDYLPRSNDFGLAVLAFHAKFCQSCPAFFFAIAVHSSNLLPDNRPSFQELGEWFEMLAIREELSRLPEPPNLHKIIISVYTKYGLPLPLHLYCDPTVQDANYLFAPDVQLSQSSSLVCAKSS